MLGGGWLVYHNNTFSTTINILTQCEQEGSGGNCLSPVRQNISFIHLSSQARWWPQPSPTHPCPDHDHYRADKWRDSLTIGPRTSLTVGGSGSSGGGCGGGGGGGGLMLTRQRCRLVSLGAVRLPLVLLSSPLCPVINIALQSPPPPPALKPHHPSPPVCVVMQSAWKLELRSSQTAVSRLEKFSGLI